MRIFLRNKKASPQKPTRPVESSTTEERGAPVARLQSRILPAATFQITKI